VTHSGPWFFTLLTSVLIGNAHQRDFTSLVGLPKDRHSGRGRDVQSRRQFRIAQQSENLDEIGSVGSKREPAKHAATSVLLGSGNSVVAR
jgi:hypothetical protein